MLNCTAFNTRLPAAASSVPRRFHGLYQHKSSVFTISQALCQHFLEVIPYFVQVWASLPLEETPCPVSKTSTTPTQDISTSTHPICIRNYDTISRTPPHRVFFCSPTSSRIAWAAMEGPGAFAHNAAISCAFLLYDLALSPRTTSTRTGPSSSDVHDGAAVLLPQRPIPRYSTRLAKS